MLDHDADMIETIRTFGYRVFYGDATRLDLLRTAGAAQAKILVLSVDNVEQSLKIVDMVQENFPNLQIVARARDVPHWNALRDRGVMRVERELFDSSLRSARTVPGTVRADVPAPQQPRTVHRRGEAGTDAARSADETGARAAGAASAGRARLK